MSISRNELKNILKDGMAIEISENGNMDCDWLEVVVKFDGDIISTGASHDKHFEQPT
tara:strand:+ start:2712 stop:2882 length:171 start_codon:yes stop_codon:yes gene_type:complete